MLYCNKWKPWKTLQLFVNVCMLNYMTVALMISDDAITSPTLVTSVSTSITLNACKSVGLHVTAGSALLLPIAAFHLYVPPPPLCSLRGKKMSWCSLSLSTNRLYPLLWVAPSKEIQDLSFPPPKHGKLRSNWTPPTTGATFPQHNKG